MLADSVRSQQTTISASTAETTIVTADASQRLDLVGLVVTTPNAAASTMTLKDGTAGTTVAIFNYPNAASAPGAPFVVLFPRPLKQAAKNKAWTLTCSANAATVQVLALYDPNTV